MQNLYAQTLRQIIVQHGRTICEDPRKLKALLTDHLGKQPGQHEQPINVLILALENRVVQDLLVSDALPANVTQRRISERLKSNLGLTEQMANWAVATWNTALQPAGVSVAAPAPVTAAAPVPVSTAAGVKPNALPLGGANQATEGAASMKFRSMTQAAGGLVRNAVQSPFWRKPLGMFLGGGLAGVLAMLMLILFFRSGDAAPPTPTQASAPEPTKPPPPPDTWKAIFRSADPSLWNDDVNRGPDQFGMALDLVPSDIRYLRLTNMSNKEFVIIEMTKDRLGKQSDDGRVGWDGRNAFDSDAYHLGIFYKIWGVGRDETLISWPGFRGWGFGHGAFVNGRQFYAWEGKNIERTVFEIAVKSEPLTEVEGKKLLKVGVVRQ